jgi:DNA-binding transcriptional regulator YdaS (Cro superfamily)
MNALSGLLAERGMRPSDLARALGLNKSTVSRWDAIRVPAERVLEVEKATGIPRQALRPDLYPAPQPAAAE